MKRSVQQKTLALFLMASPFAAMPLAEPAAAEDSHLKGKPQWAKARGSVAFIDLQTGRLGLKEPGGAVLVYTFSPDLHIRRNHAEGVPGSIFIGDKVQFLRYDRRNRHVERIELMSL